MASNAQKIIDRYGDGSREEGRNSGARADYIMEYRYTKKIQDRYVTKSSNVLEIGCGTGYYGMYLADKCKHYTGIDIAPGNIDLLEKKIRENGLDNVSAFVGDATDLTSVETGVYDVVLAFGPMYHLPPEESELVFAECGRVCKPGGIIMVAYINKVGVYLGACLQDTDNYPNKEKNASILQGGIDDSRDGIYWFSMPEEMEQYAAKHNMTVLENLGVDFVFVPAIYDQTSNNADSWEELADFMCNSKSCTGFANHAVMVCKNE